MNSALFLLIILKFGVVTSLSRKFCVKVNCNHILIWKADRQDFVSLTETFFPLDNRSYRFQMKNETVKLGVNPFWPYVILRGNSTKIDGYIGDIWMTMQEYYKFKTVIKPKSGKTEVWEINERKINTIITIKSNEIISSQPLSYIWYHIYTKKPKPIASSSSHFQIFQLKLWIAVISAFLSITFILWLVSKLLHRLSQQNLSLPIPVCYFAITAGFINQGYDIGSTAISARIIVLSSLIFGFVLYAAMNSNLIAYLATSEIRLPFKQLDDIATLKSHVLCLRNTSMAYRFGFSDSKGLLPKWKGIVNGPGCPDISIWANIPKVICNSSVIIMETRAVMIEIQRQITIPCEITQLDKKLFYNTFSLPISRKFRFTEHINLFIIKMRNYGLISALRRKWTGSKQKKSEVDALSPISIRQISSLLILLGVGIFISLAILFIELVIDGF